MYEPGEAGARAVTDRGNGCPHLGLEEDPFARAPEPSPRHRCYLWMQRGRIDLAHQASFCLTGSHTICPWLSISAPLSARLDGGGHTLRQATRAVVAPSSRRAAAIVTVLWAWLSSALAGVAGLSIALFAWLLRAVARIGSLAAALWLWLRPVLARLARRAAALAAECWRRMRPAIGRWARALGPRAARLARTLGSLAGRWGRSLLSQSRRALARLVHLAARLGVLARGRFARRAAPAGEETTPAPLSVRRAGACPSPPGASEDLPGTPEDPAPTLVGSAGPPTAEVAPAGSEAAAELVERGILALREGSREVAYALFVRATEAAPNFDDGWLWRTALARSAEEKRECLEQLLRLDPESSFARAALAQLDETPRAGGPVPPVPAPPARPPAQPGAIIWQCLGCDAINTGPLRVCRACGRPSPVVEEELMSSDDALLEQGLAGLKAGNEESAYRYFVMACKASPDNELAWQWRARTAPDLDEVIHCTERILKINPENVRARADLVSALERREREKARAVPRPATRAALPRKAALTARRVVRELRWWLLQLAGLCSFALGLVLALPYVLRLAGPPSRPEVADFLAKLPALGLPEMEVHPPYLPTVTLGSVVALVLGLLLLHAAFVIVNSGGLGPRVWTALLNAGVGWLLLSYGTGSPAQWYATAVAAVAVVVALAGASPASTPEVRERPAAGWRG